MWEAELRECLPQGPSPGLDLDRRVTLAGTPVESLDGLHRPAWGVEGGVSGGGTVGMQLEFTSVVAGGGLGRLQRQRSEVPEGRRWWGTNWSFVW